VATVRTFAWGLLAFALLVLGFISIASATVLSNLSSAAAFAAAWGVGVAALLGLFAFSNRIERWKRERKAKPLLRDEA